MTLKILFPVNDLNSIESYGILHTNTDEMTVKVFLAVKAEADHETDIITKLKARKSVKEIYLIKSRTYDVIASIEVDSLDSYRSFLDEIAHLKGVRDFESFIRTDSD